MNPASKVSKNIGLLTKEPENHKNEKTYSAQPKKFKHGDNIENNLLTSKEIKSDVEKNRTKNKNRHDPSGNSEKSKEKRMRKKRLKRNSSSSITVTLSSNKILNETGSPQPNTILKWLNKSTNNSALTSLANLSVTNGVSKYKKKFTHTKQDIEDSVTKKNKNSYHTVPTKEKKNLQDGGSLVHIKSAKLIPDKCPDSKTLSCPQSGNISSKSSKQNTKSDSPLLNEVPKKDHKNGIDNSKYKRKAHVNTNKLKISRKNENINMTHSDKTAYVNDKTKMTKQEIEDTVTEKMKHSYHSPTEERKNWQEGWSPMLIKSRRLTPDKCSVSKTLSCPQSGNLSTKSSKQNTKSNSKSPLVNRKNKDINMTRRDKTVYINDNTNYKTKLNKQDTEAALSKKNKNPHHTPTEKKKSSSKKRIKSLKLSSNECSVSKTHFLFSPQSGICIKSSKDTAISNSRTNEDTQTSHENVLDNIKCEIKAHRNTNKPSINLKKKNSMTPMDKISTKKQKNERSNKQISLQTLDGYLNISAEKSNKRKLSKKEASENCELSVVNDKKSLKPRKSNDLFKKYGVAMPSVEDILKEQKDFAQYKNQIESFQHIIDGDKFDLPFSVKTSKNSEVVHQNVLDCKHLTTQEIENAFYRHFDYISAIFNGETDNERHTRFFSTNVKNYTFTVKNLCYNTSTIVFTFEQQEHMIALLKKEFDPSDRWTLYFFQVLLPELCLKIFMDTHCMEYDEAVKYLDTRPILDD